MQPCRLHCGVPDSYLQTGIQRPTGRPRVWTRFLATAMVGSSALGCDLHKTLSIPRTLPSAQTHDMMTRLPTLAHTLANKQLSTMGGSLWGALFCIVLLEANSVWSHAGLVKSVP